eukprot:SAG31_NODE_154_length_22184_cov_25.917142_21_plen_294_part_00
MRQMSAVLVVVGVCAIALMMMMIDMNSRAPEASSQQALMAINAELRASVENLQAELTALSASPDARGDTRELTAEEHSELLRLRTELTSCKAAATPPCPSPLPCPSTDSSASTRGRKKGIIHNLLLKLELDDMYAALRNVPPGICVDVGGHIGHTAAEMASYGHTVHVFEPFQGNLPQLRASVESYGDRVKVYHGGVSAVGGTRGFGNAATKSTDATVVKGESSYIAKAGTSAVGALTSGKDGCVLGPNCIQSYVLDEVFPTEHLLMVKIDVQGGESGVLKGMTKMITERRVT